MFGRRFALIATVFVGFVVAASNDVSAGGRHHGRVHYHGGHSSFHYSPFRPYRHFGFGFGLGALSVYQAYTPSYYVYDRDRPEYSDIETDIRPSSAAVYVDGDPVGIVDDFNGWPTKLRVEPGRHELLFREPGYEPLRIEVDVLPFHSMRINERMVRGEDLAPVTQSTPPATSRSTIQAERPDARPDARQSRGRSGLILLVEPPDASVYVDGVLVDQRSGALQRYVIDLAPGAYRIEVAKPGYQAFTGEITLRDRQRQELSVRLDRS